MKTYGLIGGDLSYSFSQTYFQEKFLKEEILDCEYINFELNSIEKVKEIISDNDLSGLNITIPFKEEIIPYLDFISDEVRSIEATNTIKIINGKLHGFNTDVIGFEESINPILNGRKTALILGNGGASKAIQFVLNKLKIHFKVISRNSEFDYCDIDKETIENTEVFINTTPLGCYPRTNESPDIPYQYLNSKHLLFDLVYNPGNFSFDSVL